MLHLASVCCLPVPPLPASSKTILSTLVLLPSSHTSKYLRSIFTIHIAIVRIGHKSAAKCGLRWAARGNKRTRSGEVPCSLYELSRLEFLEGSNLSYRRASRGPQATGHVSSSGRGSGSRPRPELSSLPPRRVRCCLRFFARAVPTYDFWLADATRRHHSCHLHASLNGDKTVRTFVLLPNSLALRMCPSCSCCAFVFLP